MNQQRKGSLMFRTLLALSLVVLFGTGCNTIAGAGRDIERTGEVIQDSSHRNR
jgi:predicted small secreted protein